jgi:hypothetical protein
MTFGHLAGLGSRALPRGAVNRKQPAAISPHACAGLGSVSAPRTSFVCGAHTRTLRDFVRSTFSRIPDDAVFVGGLWKNSAGTCSRSRLRALSCRLLESRVSRLARDHGANRISGDDVGHRLPSRSSQPGSNRDCALFERRDSTSADRVFRGYGDSLAGNRWRRPGC